MPRPKGVTKRQLKGRFLDRIRYKDNIPKLTKGILSVMEKTLLEQGLISKKEDLIPWLKIQLEPWINEMIDIKIESDISQLLYNLDRYLYPEGSVIVTTEIIPGEKVLAGHDCLVINSKGVIFKLLTTTDTEVGDAIKLPRVQYGQNTWSIYPGWESTSTGGNWFIQPICSPTQLTTLQVPPHRHNSGVWLNTNIYGGNPIGYRDCINIDSWAPAKAYEAEAPTSEVGGYNGQAMGHDHFIAPVRVNVPYIILYFWEVISNPLTHNS